jgi:hypothetical protein
MSNKDKVNCKSFRPAIAYIKQELGTNLTGAEIGVYKGDNAEFILSIIQPKMLYLVDPWNNFLDQDSNEIIGEVQYLETQQRLKEYGNKRLIKKTSLEASKLFKDEEFNFVYIDADHSYDGVSQDLHLWYSKVKNGGILSGHDYHKDMLGVVMAVNEFCDEHKLKLMYALTDWWVVK